MPKKKDTSVPAEEEAKKTSAEKQDAAPSEKSESEAKAVDETPKKDVAVTEETLKKPTVPSNGKNILIVEDERPLAHALELKFTHEGFQTKTCTDGAEGLKEAMAGTYHVVLLDLIMPQLDGFAFMEQLRAKGVNTPVIVLSNLGQDEDKQKAKELGALDYFVKSNTPITDIVKRVQSAL